MSCKEKNPAVTLTLQDPGVELPGTEAGVEAEVATGAGVEIVAHGGTAGKELRKEIAAGTEISLGGMNQEGMTREEAIPEEKTPGEKITGGMTPGEGIPGRTTLIGMTPEGMIPGGTTPIGMTQERMISEGMTPRGMIPEGMTLRRMTTRGMFPGIETHIKVNRGGMNQVEMMHREMKKERATLKGGRAEIGKGVNRLDLVQQRGSKERRAVRLAQWTE